MKTNRILRIILLLSLVVPAVSYADNTDVASWTEKILLTTLSMNDVQKPTDLTSLKQNYTVNAWMGLTNFFSEQIKLIKSQNLTLHPQPLAPAIIAEQGVTSGIQYWRVNQSFKFTEAKVILNFSVIVIKAHNPPFLIQSLSVTKNQAP